VISAARGHDPAFVISAARGHDPAFVISAARDGMHTATEASRGGMSLRLY